MPKIDPETGVPVLTIMEFFAKQGEREGKTAVEVMTETYQSMADEEQRYLDEIKTPLGGLRLIQEVIQQENENNERLRKEDTEYKKTYPNATLYDIPDVYPDVIEVLEVTGAWYSGGVKSEEIIWSARVKTETGEIKTVRYTRSYWGGTYLTPPEEEIELVFED